ncbi:MAG: NAD(P)-dependent glycerol-3-phosphate dehydrogenase [Erysipelotrichaceae bacterium]|nr:NAD(P)-dependent glycerol-3-phosphate dehydrogenase [Erysipelotrichaceae bacterium]
MKISVLGSGSWGCALAQILVKNGHDVVLWGIDETEVNDINQNHMNSRYFHDVKLDSRLKATMDMSEVAGSEALLLAVPSIAIEDVIQKAEKYCDEPFYVINVAKGFHPVTHERMSVVIERAVDSQKLRDVVSLIGPSHAEEVVVGLMTCVNAVCENEESAKVIQEVFSNDYFRVYRNTDVVGAEIGVALKNVMAIASGVLTGLGQGDNARAAMMTRGLAEIARYGIAFGGKPETYLGLDGVGDLIVTCTSYHSRNFTAGLAIGKADCAVEFLKNNTKTVEGIRCAKVVYEESKRMGITMPITDQVYKVLYEGKQPSVAMNELMSRELKAE